MPGKKVIKKNVVVKQTDKKKGGGFGSTCPKGTKQVKDADGDVHCERPWCVIM